MAIDWGKFLQGVGDLSQVAGATAGGRATGRLAEAGANQRGADLDLQRKRYLNSAPSAFAGQSVISDILKNAGDFKLNVPGVNTGASTGGIRPSALGPVAKDAASSLAASAKARMAELPTSSGTGTGEYFGNSPDLMPQPGLIDKVLGGVGTFGSIAGAAKPLLGAFGIGGTAAGAGGAAGGGAATAGTAGAAGGIGALGAATMGIGAGVAIALAIKKHQNATKGDRNNFAKDAGFKDIAAFNEYLSTLGPAGQAARNYGENVVGKHNKQQEAQWMQMVQAAVDQSGKPLTTGQQPRLSRMMGGG